MRIFISVKRWEILVLLGIVALTVAGVFVYRHLLANPDFEVVDELGGNIFPSAVIATATTDEMFVKPSGLCYVGSPRSMMGIRLRSRQKNTRVRVEVAETPFFHRSVSEFVLPKAWTEYTVFPDIVWNYGALRNNSQATPLSVVVLVSLNGKATQERVRTFSVRSINECLLGYYHFKRNGKRDRFVSTRQLFAAYVNEDNPKVDKVLREALNTRIINRFLGYQRDSAQVVKQVYALWNVLQRRNFKYSSISNSSLSSNVVFAQRVRTFDDAMESSQINCVDGSVLFASLLRAVNIDPILVRLPNHMFVGFYTDQSHKHADYLETTMIGDINLDDYFPDEKLDSTLEKLGQNEASRMTFEKSMEYARKNMAKYGRQLKNQAVGFMFLPITSDVRRKIQPIGK